MTPTAVKEHAHVVQPLKMPEKMPKQTLRVPAWEDGFPIAVTVFTPETDVSDHEKVVIIISGATGCWQHYYAAFATWLTNHGVAAVTWDYRYTGDSLPLDIPLPASKEARLEIILEVIRSPDVSKISLTKAWGMKDQPAVVEFTLNKFKGYQLIMIGHSAGGHIMPLLPDKLRSQIYRPIFLAANHPSYQFIPPDKLDNFLDTWLMTIKAAEKDGYLPRSVSYFGIALPAKPAIEWTRAMLAEGQRHFAANPELVSFFRSWKPKDGLLSLAFDDDLSISGQNDNLNMDGWCDVFPSAEITRVLVPHADYGMENVGHVGMFKRENEKAWELMKDLGVYGKIPNGKVRRWIQGKAQL